jgi:hypothetical protein
MAIGTLEPTMKDGWAGALEFATKAGWGALELTPEDESGP